MKSKVFCIGTLKTGTTSIGRALRILGYKHTGFNEKLLGEVKRGNRQALIDYAQDYEAFDDWPWAVGDVYADLDRGFPGSKFIYTDRDLISWARSYYNYFYKDPDWPHGDVDSFEDEFPDMIIKRRDRKRRVLRHFADRPEDLLVVNIMSGDGWAELCPFLGVPVPDAPFPHANKTSQGSDPIAR